MKRFFLFFFFFQTMSMLGFELSYENEQFFYNCFSKKEVLRSFLKLAGKESWLFSWPALCAAASLAPSMGAPLGPGVHMVTVTCGYGTGFGSWESDSEQWVGCHATRGVMSLLQQTGKKTTMESKSRCMHHHIPSRSPS